MEAVIASLLQAAVADSNLSPNLMFAQCNIIFDLPWGCTSSVGGRAATVKSYTRVSKTVTAIAITGIDRFPTALLCH